MFKRFSVQVEEDQAVGLEELAEDQQKSVAAVIADAINAHLAANRWKGTVGDTAVALIREGMTNQEVLEAVRERFPAAKTSAASVSWYRSTLRREDPEVLTDAQARSRKTQQG